MEKVVAADGLSLWVGQEGECVPLLFTQFTGRLRRVDADGYQGDVAVIERVDALLKAPQLGVAEGSPRSAIEDEHDPS